MKIRGIQLVVSGLLCLAVMQAVAIASPAFTYQMWTFDDNDNPAAPEVDENDFGIASAFVTASGDDTFGSHGWANYVQGHYGVWYGDMVVAELTIPNQPEPNWYKEIWIEILGRGYLPGEEYTGTGYGLGEGYEVLAPLGGVTEDLGFTATPEPDGWIKIVFGLRIYPNPDFEIIRFTLLDTGAAIDHIIVNTACIPEPMTLVILGLGGLFSIRLRRL